MKVAIICDSPLLDRALKNFLGDIVAPLGGCDFVISDRKRELHKPVFVVGNDEDSDLNKPFSKSTLLLKLEKFYENDYEDEGGYSVELLKKRIATLTDRFLTDVYMEIDRFAKN